MTGMALLAALAWHQVREKPHLQLEQDDAALVGTILDKPAESREADPEQNSPEQAIADACSNNGAANDPDEPCRADPENATAPAEEQRENGA